MDRSSKQKINKETQVLNGTLDERALLGIFSCFSYDPTDVGNFISGFSAFSKSSLNIWNFIVPVLLKPGLENFEHYFASMRDECNHVIV